MLGDDPGFHAETGEVTDRSTIAVTSEPKPPEQQTALKLEDYLEDIANAPSFEGLRYKSEQTMAAFTGAKAHEAIDRAFTERQNTLSADSAKKAAESEPGAPARKLFENTAKHEGAAA